MLTCTDNQSRNRRLGLLVAKGMSIEAATQEIGQVVEGARVSRELHNLAIKLGIDMPIAEQVYRVVHEGATVLDALQPLTSRAPRPEIDD